MLTAGVLPVLPALRGNPSKKHASWMKSQASGHPSCDCQEFVANSTAEPPGLSPSPIPRKPRSETSCLIQSPFFSKIPPEPARWTLGKCDKWPCSRYRHPRPCLLRRQSCCEFMQHELISVSASTLRRYRNSLTCSRRFN